MNYDLRMNEDAARDFSTCANGVTPGDREKHQTRRRASKDVTSVVDLTCQRIAPMTRAIYDVGKAVRSDAGLLHAQEI